MVAIDGLTPWTLKRNITFALTLPDRLASLANGIGGLLIRAVDRIIAEFHADIKRARRISDDKLRRNQLFWFREKLREATELLPHTDKEKVLKAYADSFSDADYRPLTSSDDVPDLLAAIRATPVGEVLVVAYQCIGDHPQKLTRMESELQDICRQNDLLTYTRISAGILWAAPTPFKDQD